MVRIRLATADDAQALIDFNSAMALETEGKKLLPEVIGAGVRSLLGNPASGFYVVAEANGRVVASLMITKEWSDWRNGNLWWIQSVYVRSSPRGIRPYVASGFTSSARTMPKRLIPGVRFYR
jgi:hypothetical protein